MDPSKIPFNALIVGPTNSGKSKYVVDQIYGPFRGKFLFYTPSAKTTKAIFEDYAGELSHDEYKNLISKLKERKFSYLVFSLRFPYGIHLN